jgi:hypothetical protein
MRLVIQETTVDGKVTVEVVYVPVWRKYDIFALVGMLSANGSNGSKGGV